MTIDSATLAHAPAGDDGTPASDKITVVPTAAVTSDGVAAFGIAGRF